MTWVAVAVGGAIGSLVRHFVNVQVGRWLERTTPWATFTVNVIGCLIIGGLAGAIASGKLQLSPAARTFVFVGLLGGFTTFSSLGLDTLTLLQGGQQTAAFWNVAGQVGLGLGAVWVGYNLGL